MGTTVWENPEQLKFLLGPVIARSEADQDRFYKEFDAYWQALQKDLSPPKKVKKVNKWKTRLAWIFISLAGLALLSYLFIFRTKDYEFTKRPIAFVIPVDTSVNTQVQFYFVDSADFKAYKTRKWTLRNKGESKILAEAEGDFSTFFDLGARDNLQEKTITFDFQWGPHHYTFSRDIYPPCTYDRKLDIKAPNDGQINRPINLSVNFSGHGEWTLLVDFGDKITDKIQLGVPSQYTQDFSVDLSHTYEKEGQYKINFKLRSDVEVISDCKGTSSTRTINIGEKGLVAAPPPMSLEKMPLRRIATLRWGPITGVFLFFSALIALLNFLIHNIRNRKQEEAEAAAAKAAAVDLKPFEKIDGPPYNIPFKNHDNQIPIDESAYHFANALRRRQTGLLAKLDVPATVSATLQKAGMPTFQYAFGSRPSEYLFLIDRTSEQSHQARLMALLALQMKEQDVLVETYYYRENLLHFWNEQNTKGLSLELLYRRYPNHRLVILGNAHHLLDPYNRNQHKLRPYELAQLEHWDFRMLLTPVPPANWSYQERELYRLFAIYPADTDGFLAASKLLDSLDEQPVERIPFKKWQSVLMDQRNDPSIKFRRWHRATDLKKYFDKHLALWTWVAALSVYPELDWALTIAIGEDLAKHGVEVNFENLLIISRIEWLKEGEWPPRLRLALLKELESQNPDALNQARATVIREIKAVEPITQKGYANQDAQKQLAIQNHMLTPENKDQKAILQALLDQGFLNKEEQEEIQLEGGRPSENASLIRLEAIKRLANAGDLGPAIDRLMGFVEEEAPNFQEHANRLLREYKDLLTYEEDRFSFQSEVEEGPAQKFQQQQTYDFEVESQSIESNIGPEAQEANPRLDLQIAFRNLLDELHNFILERDAASEKARAPWPIWQRAMNLMLMGLLIYAGFTTFRWNNTTALHEQAFGVMEEAPEDPELKMKWWVKETAQIDPATFLNNWVVDYYNGVFSGLLTEENSQEYYERLNSTLTDAIQINEDEIEITISTPSLGNGAQITELLTGIGAFNYDYFTANRTLTGPGTFMSNTPQLFTPTYIPFKAKEAFLNAFVSNNQGPLNNVQQQQEQQATTPIIQTLENLNPAQYNIGYILSYADSLLNPGSSDRTMTLIPLTTVPAENYLKLIFNTAYQELKEESFEAFGSLLDPGTFNELANDTSMVKYYLDYLHAMGLAGYYTDQSDSANAILNRILETDSLYFDTLSYAPNLRTLLNFQPLVDPAIEKARAKIIGRHAITCQWISDTEPGFINIVDRSTRITARGQQVVNDSYGDQNVCSIEGTIEIINEWHFKFTGTIIIDKPYDKNFNPPCVREGTFDFKASPTSGRKYWRLAQATGYCGKNKELTDYIDIFFKQE